MKLVKVPAECGLTILAKDVISSAVRTCRFRQVYGTRLVSLLNKFAMFILILYNWLPILQIQFQDR